LTTLAVILGFEVRQKIALIKRLDERDKLRFICDASVKVSIAELFKEEEKDYSSLNDKSGNNISAFKDIPVGDGFFSVSYSLISDGKQADIETRYGLADEQSKININKSEPEVMARLFEAIGLDEDASANLAVSIKDWRDDDSDLSAPTGSAEDPYYRSLSHEYDAKDADFQVVDELLLVKDMDEKVFKKINDYITIYGNGKVNINTAGRFVLEALGLSEEVAQYIIVYRNGKDNTSGTQDDGFFYSPQDMVAKISETFNLTDSQKQELDSVVQKESVCTKSSFFMIKSTARLNHGKNSKDLICVISRSGGIFYWNES
jgi:hypothetical protein